MILVDTSIWIDIFRDAGGSRRATLEGMLDGEAVALTRFHQLEMLQGCRDEKEWALLASYLEGQDYLEMALTCWQEAARIYFDLRRMGRTVGSPIDCCIAQVALDHDVLLIHHDKDFETIATIRPLRQVKLEW